MIWNRTVVVVISAHVCFVVALSIITLALYLDLLRRVFVALIA